MNSKTFQIFKAGKHISASGAEVSFSESDLEAAIKAYDPAIHEAPIVIGHPKDNHPAYGWVKSLSFADGAINAEAIQVDKEFAEMVQAGRFKKRSASFYAPDSPNNPVKGVYYLRHVGFLGAQPPAVKGLKDVNFSDNEEGVIEFADAGLIATAFRKLREWIISQHNSDEADKVLPNYLVQALEEDARRDLETPTAAVLPAFSEDETMSKEQLDALQAQLAASQAENAKLKEQAGKVAEFSEKETALKAREDALMRKEIESTVDGLVTAGKVLPAQKKSVVDFACSLQNEVTIDFTEGDKTEKRGQRDVYLSMLAAQPKAVDFGEHSKPENAGGGKEADDFEVARLARNYRDEQTAKGIHINFTEAVEAVRQGKVKSA